MKKSNPGSADRRPGLTIIAGFGAVLGAGAAVCGVMQVPGVVNHETGEVSAESAPAVDSTAPLSSPLSEGPFAARFTSLVDVLAATEASGATPTDTTIAALAATAGVTLSRISDPNEADLRGAAGETALAMGADTESGAGLSDHAQAAAACGSVAVLNPAALASRDALQAYAQGQYEKAADACTDAARVLASNPNLVVASAE